MLKIICFIFLIFNINFALSQEPSVEIPETILIISENYNRIIKNYVEKIPNNYIVRVLYYNDKTNNNLILNKVIEYHPYLILLFGDNTIINIFSKNVDFFTFRNTAYSSIYSNKTVNDIDIKGISYIINYDDLNKLMKLFDHIVIFKNDSQTSSIIASDIYDKENFQIETFNIKSLYSLRKTLSNLNNNTLIINLLFSRIEDHSTREISNELLNWGGNVVLDFNSNRHSIVSLVPDYQNISNELIKFTLDRNNIKNIKVRLIFNLNIKNLETIRKQYLVKKIEKNIFEIIKNE